MPERQPSQALNLDKPDGTGIQKSVFEGTNRISALSGEIARIETELILKKGEINDAMADRIAIAIASCREEALKWKLGQIASDAGVFQPSPAVQGTANPLANDLFGFRFYAFHSGRQSSECRLA